MIEFYAFIDALAEVRDAAPADLPAAERRARAMMFHRVRPGSLRIGGLRSTKRVFRLVMIEGLLLRTWDGSSQAPYTSPKYGKATQFAFSAGDPRLTIFDAVTESEWSPMLDGKYIKLVDASA